MNIYEEIKKLDPSLIQISDEERKQMTKDLLKEGPHGSVWIFGYGSLMWNPAFEYIATKVGTLHGYHRDFCISSTVGRGNKECPGLVLAIREGGGCEGKLFCLSENKKEALIYHIMCREMVTGVYHAKWVTICTNKGDLKALTFTCNEDHEQVAKNLTFDCMAQRIAVAEGSFGTSYEYFFNMRKEMNHLGITDENMEILATKVDQYRKATN